MKTIIENLRKILPYLPSGARRFLWVYAVVTSVLSIVDVLALMLLAVTLASAIQGNPVVLPVIGTVYSESFGWLILVLSALIIAKSAASLGLQWAATRRFASYELSVGDHLFAAYIHAPWTDRLRRNTAEIVQMADTGIANVTAGFLLPVMTLPGLLITSLGVVSVIVITQPVTALVTIVYLGGIAAVQYLVLGRRTREAGRIARDSALHVAALISGMVAALKEITLRNKADEVAAVVNRNRARTARARANVSFLSAAPRFVFDSAIVGGFILTGGVAWLLGGMEQAISAVALFGIAGFRLVPSLTSFQGVITRTVTASPYVDAVIEDITRAEVYLRDHERLGLTALPSDPRRVELKSVSFTYPGTSTPALYDVSLGFDIGSTIGIVGSSGAGKSTLVDILLGLLVPSSGELKIDDKPLADVLAGWRARVGYVPQDVSLFDGTIAQNVALTWGSNFDVDRVEAALRRAQLWSTVEGRAEGVNTRIGERGIALSGGQRQRLGIARALYSDPLVLVLDEATSALDTKTESDVSFAIRSLHGDVTVISVAHRLSTIRDADQVLFMKDGTIAASGTFEAVVAAHPEFAHQAALAGLMP